jgi:drug/metabolite transporter (DMT)-like permease
MLTMLTAMIVVMILLLFDSLLLALAQIFRWDRIFTMAMDVLSILIISFTCCFVGIFMYITWSSIIGL